MAASKDTLLGKVEAIADVLIARTKATDANELATGEILDIFNSLVKWVQVKNRMDDAGTEGGGIGAIKKALEAGNSRGKGVSGRPSSTRKSEPDDPFLRDSTSVLDAVKAARSAHTRDVSDDSDDPERPITFAVGSARRLPSVGMGGNGTSAGISEDGDGSGV